MRARDDICWDGLDGESIWSGRRQHCRFDDRDWGHRLLDRIMNKRQEVLIGEDGNE